MLFLDISDKKKLVLEFSDNNIHRFSECKLLYKSEDFELNICEDFLYIFIEDMLGRIKEIPIITEIEMFGKIGRWQEYYYYDSLYVQKYSKEIELMENSIFVSAENYGSFLYKFNGRIYMELNRGYCESCTLNPYEYYNSPDNYNIFICQISYEMLHDWKEKLEKIEESIR